MPNKDSIYIDPTVPEEVTKLCNALKDSASGHDGFNRTIISVIFQTILGPLVHIIKLSLFSGVVPKEIKIAKVKPLFKADNQHLFNNYRPTSILPILSKLFEKIMHSRVYKFLNKNNYFYKFHFGFREKHSTELALMTLTHTIASSFNDNKIILGIFLDLSKAFDTVNFQNLLDKLYYYCIRGTPLLWLKFFLTDRLQYITFKEYFSDEATTQMGVPQGSILGPLLFLIYINNLYKVSSKCFPIMFADDSSFFLDSQNSEH